MITLQEAWQRLDEQLRPVDCITVDLATALGQSLAEPIASDVDVPPHRKSIVDGFAVRASDINDGKASLEIIDEVIAGSLPSRALDSGQATRIMTGAPMPEGADSVVMVEETTVSDDNSSSTPIVSISTQKFRQGQNVMDQAAVMRRDEVVLQPGAKLGPAEIGLLAETGHTQIQVVRPIQVAIVSTGNELVPASQIPGPSQIRNSNGPMLAALAASVGTNVVFQEHAPDAQEALAEAIAKGLQADILLLSGGVSAGKMDLVPAELQRQNVHQVFHKVSLKPGKPIWFGTFEAQDHRALVFGLPGNPVSSLIGFRLFVQRAIRGLSGMAFLEESTFSGTLASPFVHRGNRPTYWPAKFVVGAARGVVVEPVAWRGSGDLRTLAEADCWIAFPAGDQKYETGHPVDVIPK